MAINTFRKTVAVLALLFSLCCSTYAIVLTLNHTNAYAYDAVGNRLTQTVGTTVTTYGYDVANRLTHLNGIPTYTYDDNGNLLSDGVSSYQYDGANRLITLTQGVDVYAYAYDGIGNRVAQSVNTLPLNPSGNGCPSGTLAEF